MNKLKNHTSSTKYKLIFFGNERLATAVGTEVPVLRSLVQAGYEIKSVVVSHSEGVSRQKRGLEIVEVAHAYHIPVLITDELAGLGAQLASLGAQAGILAAFGRIVPQSIIDIFPKGIINIHPSLLPVYRGPTPVETAILDGAQQTGVSLMGLTAKMDAGPIYKQQAVELKGNETKPQLARHLLNIGAKLLVDNLGYILDGTLEPIPQDPSAATYTKLLTKSDGQLDFRRPAEVLERQVRAFAGWPGSRTRIWGQDVIITRAHAVPGVSDGPGVVVALKEGVLMLHAKDGYLCVDNLKPAGKSEMSAAEFISGYKKT